MSSIQLQARSGAPGVKAAAGWYRWIQARTKLELKLFLSEAFIWRGGAQNIILVE